MSKYRIVAARPKGQTNHVKSEFKTLWYGTREGKTQWWSLGWKTINEVSDRLAAGHDVRTGRFANGVMEDGAPVELELRTTKNNSKFEISTLPDS